MIQKRKMGNRILFAMLAVFPLTRSASAQDTTTLQDVVPSFFAVGGHIHGWNFDFDDLNNQSSVRRDPYLDLADREFNAITSSQYMAFNGVGDVSGFVAAIEWATSRNKRVHGHSLLYPEFNNHPGARGGGAYWSSDEFVNSGKSVQDVVQEHLLALCNAGKGGKVYLWDVVNEVFAQTYHSPDIAGKWGLRNDYREYYEVGNIDDGEEEEGSYVEWAFYQARACDPDAILILLETNAEEENIVSDSMYRYVTTMRERGVPIDGVGFQMHVWPGGKDWESTRRNFQRFADAGLRIFITEMDVMTEGGTTNVHDRPSHEQLIAQAAIFRRVAELARDMPAIESLYLWDFADDPSWMHPSSFAIGSSPAGTYYFPTPFYGGYSYVEKKTSGTHNYDYAYDGLLKGLAGGVADGGDDGNLDSDISWKRIQSEWEPDSGFIAIVGEQDSEGIWFPTPEVGLVTLADESWWSVQWVFEKVTSDIYRLRCRWGDGYLTRVGTYDEAWEVWFPTEQITVKNLNESWASQQWRLEPGDILNWRIINTWDSDTGFLTRNGIPNGLGGYTPDDSFRLYERHDGWGSQYWNIRMV